MNGAFQTTIMCPSSQILVFALVIGRTLDVFAIHEYGDALLDVPRGDFEAGDAPDHLGDELFVTTYSPSLHQAHDGRDDCRVSLGFRPGEIEIDIITLRCPYVQLCNFGLESRIDAELVGRQDWRTRLRTFGYQAAAGAGEGFQHADEQVGQHIPLACLLGPA